MGASPIAQRVGPPPSLLLAVVVLAASWLPTSLTIVCTRTYCRGGGTMPCANRDDTVHEETDCSQHDEFGRGAGLSQGGKTYDACQRMRMDGPAYLGFPAGGDLSYRCAATTDRDEYHCGQCNGQDCANDWVGNGYEMQVSRTIKKTYWCCTASRCNDHQASGGGGGGGGGASTQADRDALRDWMVAVRAACAPGHYAQQERGTICYKCPAGQADTDSDPTTACTACQPGEHSAQQAVRCETCPAGRMGNALVSGCTDCPPGRYTPQPGAIGGCALCPSGTYSGSGSPNCTACASLGMHDEDLNPSTPCTMGFRYYQAPAWQGSPTSPRERRCQLTCTELGGLASEVATASASAGGGGAGQPQRTCCTEKCGSCAEQVGRCAFNPGGWRQCCPSHIVSSGVSCLRSGPPCIIEEFGRPRTDILPTGVGEPLLSVSSADVRSWSCVSNFSSATGSERTSTLARFVGKQAGPDHSYREWKAVRVASFGATTVRLFWYRDAACDAYSLVRIFDVDANACGSDNARDVTYLSTSDVASTNTAGLALTAEPPGKIGLRVVEHSDRDCASDPQSYFVALNQDDVGRCIKTDQTQELRHQWRYAKDIFGLVSDTGSFKACCTANTAVVYRFKDDHCGELESLMPGLEFSIGGCHGNTVASLRYTAICSADAQVNSCPPLVAQEVARVVLSLTFQGSADDILSSDAARAAWEASFKAAMATNLNVTLDRIIILGIVPGSFHVKLAIVDTDVSMRDAGKVSATAAAAVIEGWIKDKSLLPATTILASMQRGEAVSGYTFASIADATPSQSVTPSEQTVGKIEGAGGGDGGLPVPLVLAVVLIAVVGLMYTTWKSKAFKRWKQLRSYKQQGQLKVRTRNRTKLCKKLETDLQAAMTTGDNLVCGNQIQKCAEHFMEVSKGVLRDLAAADLDPQDCLRAAEKQLAIVTHEASPTDPSSWANDVTRIRSAFVNVVSNTVKGTAETDIAVYVHCPARSSSNASAYAHIIGRFKNWLTSVCCVLIAVDRVDIENQEGEDTVEEFIAGMEPTTIWVGRLPDNTAKNPQALTDMLSEFGEVLSVTVRRKEGERKSWALATFRNIKDAKAAISCGVKSGVTVHEHGKVYQLQLRASDIRQHLQKEGVGALSAVAASQERKLAAAVRIQSVFRGVSFRRRLQKKAPPSSRHRRASQQRRRSSEREPMRRRSSAESREDRQTRKAGDKPAQSTSRRRRASLEERIVDQNDAMPTSTDNSERTVWVGQLPTYCADKPSLLTDALSEFGKVLSTTVRRKEGDRKSWALVTFTEATAAAAAAARGRARRGSVGSASGSVTLSMGGGDDGPKKAVRVLIQQSKVDQHLEKDGSGALAQIHASQERKLAAAVRIQSVFRGKSYRKEMKKKQQSAPPSSRHRRASQQRRRSSEKQPASASDVRAADQHRIVDDDEGVLTPDMEAAMGRTVWVGAVPASCCEHDSPELKRAFEIFGKVQSVTVRRKDGECKSWALVTYAQREAATSAVGAAAHEGVHVTDSASTSESGMAAMPGQVSRGRAGVGKRCKLVVRQAKINTELSKPETGALGRMWANQERQLLAAMKIQAVARGMLRRKSSKGRKSRAKSNARKLGV